MAAEVANDYFSVHTLDNEYDLITNTIEAYRRSLELTQNRRRGGVVSDLDVAQAATLLHATEAQLPDIKLHRAQTQHALDTCAASHRWNSWFQPTCRTT